MDLANYSQTESLKNGTSVEIRSIRPDDKGMIIEAFHNLAPESIYTRFFYLKKGLSENDLKVITEVDFEDVVAFVVTAEEGPNKKIIGGGRYIVLDRTATQLEAEVAFTVKDNFHSQGVAGFLLNHLAQIARYKGISCFVADVLPENKAMFNVFSRSGLPMNQKHQDGVIHIRLSLNK